MHPDPLLPPQPIARHALSRYWQLGRDWLRQQLPHRCLLCHLPTVDFHNRLCETCWQDLPLGGFRCQGCGLSLPVCQPRCGPCQQRITSELLITAMDYTSPVREMITAFKYRRQAIFALPLAQMLLSRLFQQHRCQGMPWPDAIVPVPLHPRRCRERGFNQAALIADATAAVLGRPVLEICRRDRQTPPQVRLSARARESNLKQAFSLTAPPPYRHLAIVDDVYTTGATLRALTGLLREAGAEHIQHWCVARTPPPRCKGNTGK